MSSANNRMFSVTLYQDFSPRSKATPNTQAYAYHLTHPGYRCL